jgi:hypothetical protein
MVDDDAVELPHRRFDSLAEAHQLLPPVPDNAADGGESGQKRPADERQ